MMCFPHLGENGGEIVARLKRDLVPTLINGVMYWPICDFITFKFIPVHLQVRLILMNLKFQLNKVVNYIWNLFVVFLAAIGEQFFFIRLDRLHDIHGKPRESWHNCFLIDLLTQIFHLLDSTLFLNALLPCSFSKLVYLHMNADAIFFWPKHGWSRIEDLIPSETEDQVAQPYSFRNSFTGITFFLFWYLYFVFVDHRIILVGKQLAYYHCAMRI